MQTYQNDYAAGRPQMYEKKSREEKAIRIVKAFENTLGKGKLKELEVLDFGASTGIIDNILSQHFKTVVGIDIDKDAISFAQKNYKKKNLKFKVADALKTPFKDNSFDIVICTHVYEHVPDAQKMFDEIYRVLKPGGICYLAAINRLWPYEPHYNLLFLSWLPKPLAHMYMQISKKGRLYYETPRSYWGLKKLASKFRIIELTDKIFKEPRKYGYENQLHKNILVSVLGYPAKYFAPTLFWLLKK